MMPGKINNIDGVRACEDRVSIRSTSMQSRDEYDFVIVLQLIVELAFEFPICVIDENEDARSTESQRRDN